jgi:4-aminobutyrate aminotransferase-like enzyme
MTETRRSRIIELTRRHESSAVNTFALSAEPPLFVRGEGPLLITEAGDRFVDLVSGSAVTNLGHGLPVHRDAIERVAAAGIYHTGSRLAHVERGELYGELAALLPPELGRIHFVSTGTEAVETALKAAQYHTRRRRIFAFEGGYHGRTVGALSISDAAKLHQTFVTLEDVVTFIPFPYRFRDDPPAADQGELAAFCLETLDQRFGAAKAAGDLPSCIILEAIQGTGGAILPPAGFLREVAGLARAYDVLLVVDEIWTGFGRTGRWFAFEHDGVVPDLVCLSKGLTAGLPLAGVAGREEILGTWPAGIHTSTFQGNPVACAMARATIAEMTAHRWVEHAAGPVASTFEHHLRPLADAPGIRDIRWRGAAAAIEFADPAGGPDTARQLEVQKRCLANRLLVYGGGRQGNTIMLLPPINIDPEVLREALEVLAGVLRETA